MPVSHTGDAGSNPARGAPRCDRGVRSEAHGVASAADRVRVPAVALDGALGGQDGGLHPPERGSIPRGSTPYRRSRTAPAVLDRESLNASPVGAATAAWRHRSAVGRRTHALGRAWWRGSAVSRVGRVRLPSRALTRRSSADEHHPATVGDGGSNPPDEIRRTGPGAAALRGSCGREADVSGICPAAGGDPNDAIPLPRNRAREQTPTTGRLGRRRSDTAVERGSIPRSSISP